MATLTLHGGGGPGGRQGAPWLTLFMLLQLLLLLKFGGWGNNREIVFRVRVVRDVRAKLCASHPGYPGLATVPCPTAPPAPADRAPGLSRGCPVGCPVVFPWLSHLVVTPGCPTWLFHGVVPGLSRGLSRGFPVLD